MDFLQGMKIGPAGSQGLLPCHSERSVAKSKNLLRKMRKAP
jgi:hypothetical protein